jgi:hypothetical protein
MRTLIGKDDFLGYVFRTSKQPEPGSWVSPFFPPPPPEIATLSVGSLPSAGPNAEEEHLLIPSGFRARLCLTIRLADTGVKRFTWSQFMDLLASKTAAHIGRREGKAIVVPRHLNRMLVHGVAGIGLGAYMIRAAAVETSRAGHILLQRLGIDQPSPTHDRYFGGMHLLGVYLVANPDGPPYKLSLQAPFTVRPEMWKEGRTVVTVMSPSGERYAVEMGPAYGKAVWMITPSERRLVPLRWKDPGPLH